MVNIQIVVNFIPVCPDDSKTNGKQVQVTIDSGPEKGNSNITACFYIEGFISILAADTTSVTYIKLKLLHKLGQSVP